MIPAIVFVAVAWFVFAAYYALLARPEGQTQRALERRLTPAAKHGEAVRLAERVRAPERGARARPPARSTHETLPSPLQRWLGQSGLRWTVGTLLLLSGCGALLAT